jgi:hypothetical protein
MKSNRLAAIMCAGLLCAGTSAQAITIDSFALDVTSPAGTSSTAVLSLTETYRITVSGTFFIAPGRLADAEYYQFLNTLAWTDIRPPDIGVQIDGADVAWGAFNSTHVYSTIINGTGSTVLLSYNDVAYGDNAGALQVSIDVVPLPASGLLLLAGLGAIAARRKRA